MAIITSLGYDGTIGEAQLAAWAPTIGTPPCRVAGPAPTIRTGVVGGIRVPPSVYSAWGITDTITANVDTAASIMSGEGARWDSVCLRRNWATNTTSVVVVQGGATQAPASGLLATPGTGSADQVIALAKMVKGQTDVQQLVPWAPWAHHTLVWPAPGLPAPAGVDEGTLLVHDGGHLSVRRLSGSPAAAAWQSLTDPPWLPLSTGFSGGWGQYASAPARYRVRPGWVDLVGGVRLGASPASYTVLQLPASCWPRELRFAGGHRSSGGAKGIPYEVLVDKTGHLIIDPVWAADVIENALTPSVVYPVAGSYPL